MNKYKIQTNIKIKTNMNKYKIQTNNKKTNMNKYKNLRFWLFEKDRDCNFQKQLQNH